MWLVNRWHQRQESELHSAVFLCFDGQCECLPVILGKARNSNFAFGVFSFSFLPFFNCGNALFFKTEKSIRSTSLLLGPKNHSL